MLKKIIKHFYLLVTFLSLSLDLFLLTTTNIVIPTEILFFSYLVNKGLLPYRDFFDHHGFLLYYLVAPLTVNKTLFWAEVFYIAIQIVNLLLVLYLVKKTSSKSGFIIAAIFYPLLSYFNARNVLWYECLITSFYLLVYILLLKKKIKYRPLLIGLIIGLASLIKPQAALILLPCLFYAKSILPFLSFAFVWATTIIYFVINHGLPQLINNLFLFNWFLERNFPVSTFFHFDGKKVLLATVLLIIFSLISFVIAKQFRKKTLLFIFLFFSLVFIRTGLAEVSHLLPFFTFATILIAESINGLKAYLKPVFWIFLIIYFLFLSSKTLTFYFQNRQRITVINNQLANNIIHYLKKDNFIGNEKIYVLGGYIQIYYQFDKLPPTYFPLGFSLIDVYYPNFLNHIIADIQRNQVKYILIPNTKSFSEKELFLKKYFEDNYKLYQDNQDVKIYTR